MSSNYFGKFPREEEVVSYLGRKEKRFFFHTKISQVRRKIGNGQEGCK
jgi:hypothetical protein